MAAPVIPKLAIIAGGGALPRLLITARRSAALPYYVVGLQGFASAAELGQDADVWLRFGEAGKGFEHLRNASVTHVVMAGAVKRPSFADLKPDLKTASFFARIAGKSLGDDGLLSAVLSEIESEGFQVVGADEILSALLAPHGVLGAHKPDTQSLADIAVGAAGARDLGQ
ncbi:MAG: LpxI family protein, partial [Rhodospirillaceae bacterium]|nr:LpxI family protein [Rhodospirillaceae bacterium]